MMYKIMIRLRMIKDNTVIETIFDSRLSFLDNMKLLNRISDYQIDDFAIYDPNKKLFLDRNSPVALFNINSFMMFDVFT